MSLRLRRFKLTQERMSSGSLFHSSGAETAKALEPYDLRLKLTGVMLNAVKTVNQVSNIDRRLVAKSFVGEQDYVEFNSLGNWKPVQVE